MNEIELITVDVFVHASRESLYEKGEKLGLEGEVLHNFTFLGYEHKLTFEVHKETGIGYLVAVDGRKLEGVGA